VMSVLLIVLVVGGVFLVCPHCDYEKKA
jgi:hypothetical protein